MNSAPWAWVLLLSLFALPAQAAYKCINANGQISYQAMPCPADTQGGDMNLNVNQVFSGQAKNDAAQQPAVIVTPVNEATPPADAPPPKEPPATPLLQ